MLHQNFNSLMNEKTRLITPEMRTTERNCLQFYYHMHVSYNILALGVYVRDNLLGILIIFLSGNRHQLIECIYDQINIECS